MGNKNCWEVMNCGRGPGQSDSETCLAVTDSRFNGIHNGTNGGRTCWVAAGTMCLQKTDGKFAMQKQMRHQTCVNCDFYQQVRADEGSHFHYTAAIIKTIMGQP